LVHLQKPLQQISKLYSSIRFWMGLHAKNWPNDALPGLDQTSFRGFLQLQARPVG